MITDRSEVNLAGATWRKSRYSANQGNCIEVADGFTGTVPVRDSKDPDGPALVFQAAAWSAFVTALKAGEIPNA
ncbi:DUF397 domain-containing protein [Kitasatospora sp. NPDC057512]|uniref:DUF397 domain-containing protein n=1 Tax=Kitasatospora sp. NPDC057512 TaxID=3346154 RepID=UPI003693E0C0